FSGQPAVSAAGTLTFTPAIDASGSATVSVQIHDNGGTTNGGVDTSAIQTFTITVSLLNHAPSFTAGANDTLLEDAPAHTDLGWASSIIQGPMNESGQVLNFIVTNDSNALFSVQPAVDATTGNLTYTLAANANGLATVTVKLHDDGGTANGGSDTSAPQTMTITVTAVNDAPSFTSGGDKTVLENAGAQSFSGWATAISDGPLESAQTLNFIVTNDANALFTVQPAVSPAGVLTFTAVTNRNGSATVSVKLHDNGGTANGGVDTSATQTFVITVTHVNQVPSFTKGANQTVDENSSAQIVPGWATALSPGADPTESGQALNFIVSNDTNALFSVQPAISPAGVLTYTPATNVNGTAIVSVQIHDDGGVLNSGVDTSAIQTFTITLTLVNQAPTFTKGGDVTVLEDAGAQAIPGWATAITSGPGDPTQALNFIVTNGNNPLFSAQPAVNALGTLTFTTAANKNGSAMVTISLHDDGGTARGGIDTSASQTFVINVTAVNDAPTFTKGADISVPEETAPVTHTVTNWATNFVPGPTDELSQTVLAYTVTNNANNLFSTQPSINTGGTLSYRLAASRNGTATVSVSVRDSGGTANGGVDTSGIQTFTITITGVDHAPAAITDISGVDGCTLPSSCPFPYVIQGSGPTFLDVLANDFDTDGDTITIIGVSQGAHGTTKIAANKLSLTYDPTGSYFGGDQFEYEITDGRMTAFGTVLVTVQKDTFAPVCSAPKIVTTATSGTTATITLRWTGTDVGFGVKYYQLQESRNGGAYVSVTVPVGARSISRTVADGSTYQYRVRGVDQVGNVGTYVVSAIYKPSQAPRSGTTSHSTP
ncbi:MAG: tandem-95 repeat protein, partial [Candidatus Limnocylindrales bacterium]